MIFQETGQGGKTIYRQFTLGEDKEGDYHFWDMNGNNGNASKNSNLAQIEAQVHIFFRNEPYAIYKYNSYSRKDLSFTMSYKFKTGSDLFVKQSDEILITPRLGSGDPRKERMVLSAYIPRDKDGLAYGGAISGGIGCGLAVGLSGPGGIMPCAVSFVAVTVNTINVIEYKPIYYPALP